MVHSLYAVKSIVYISESLMTTETNAAGADVRSCINRQDAAHCGT